MLEEVYYPVSVSSVIISLMISCLLIITLHFLLTNTKNYKAYRLNYIFLIIVFLVLRLFIPIELPFTITVFLPEVMNPVISFFSRNIFQNYTVLNFILLVWVVGIILQSIRFVISCIAVKRDFDKYTKDITPVDSKTFTDSGKKGHPVYFTSLVTSPAVMGLHDAVLLPKDIYTNEQLDYLIAHEIYHLENHDMWMKLFVNILCIIYWWFPGVYILRKQISLFVEMRADNCVIQNNGIDSLDDYVQLIFEESKNKSHTQTRTDYDTSFFISESMKVLSYRLNYMTDSFHTKKTAFPLKVLLCFIVIGSTMFIFNPYFESPVNDYSGEQYYSYEDIVKPGSYILKKKDGTYELHFDDNVWKLQNPSAFDLPIIEEK